MGTTQAHNGEEVVGAVFSICVSSEGTVSKKDRIVGDDEKMVKAIEYIERACYGTSAQQMVYHRYYVVLETEKGNVILTEKLMDGTVTWEENPRDLENRTSLARVLHSADCSDQGITVRRMRRHQALLGKRCPSAK